MNSRQRKNLIKISDKLIKRIANYDSSAFEELYNKASGAVYGLAISILRNPADAEDVVQDTFISIYDNANKYQPNGKAMAWIFTITRNHALMKIRDRKKQNLVDPNELYDVGIDSTAEQEMQDDELIRVISNVLKSDERQIVMMHVMSNMKHKDIAEIMDMPLSTVLSKYRRSLKKLRSEMEVIGYEK